MDYMDAALHALVIAYFLWRVYDVVAPEIKSVLEAQRAKH